MDRTRLLWQPWFLYLGGEIVVSPAKLQTEKLFVLLLLLLAAAAAAAAVVVDDDNDVVTTFYFIF